MLPAALIAKCTDRAHQRHGGRAGERAGERYPLKDPHEDAPFEGVHLVNTAERQLLTQLGRAATVETLPGERISVLTAEPSYRSEREDVSTGGARPPRRNEP